MESLIIFLVRFTPFWAIPGFMISVELGRRLRAREANRGAAILFFLALFCIVATAYYIYAGGPDRAVEMFKS
jgi:hypothetical protein